MTCHSKRVVKAIPEEHEIDPTNYDEIMSNVDVYFWKNL